MAIIQMTEKTEDQNVVTLSFQGQITSENFEKFSELVAKEDVKEGLILDFGNIEYISSAGLRAIVSLAIKHPNCFEVINASEMVMEVFETTGFTNAITIKAANPNEDDTENDPSQRGFSTILRKRAEENPNEVYIIEGDRVYTWKDMEMISQLIAHDLAKKGVKHFTHVGIFAEENPLLLCTFFAIQKLGGIAVMLNPAFTAKELISMAEIGDVTHICYGQNVPADKREEFCKEITSKDSLVKETYYIDTLTEYQYRYCEYYDIEEMYQERFNPDDPCLMIYTSGSTGKPKGALHSYFTLYSSVKHFAEVMGTCESDRFAHTLPSFHIAGIVFNLLNTFFFGGILCYPDYSGAKGIVERMTRVLDLVEKEKCTMLHAVPTPLLSIAGLPTFTPEKVKSVRFILTGSQPIMEQQMNTMLEGFTNATICVVYGMTEMIPASYVVSNDSREHLLSSVGKPIDEAKAEIVNPDGTKLPTGQTGEIRLMGPQSICGYYKVPLEKQPFDADGGLRTGDLGFLDEDGYLHLAGRIKDIIIRGGENIVPGEIMVAISECPGIKDVYVCGVPDMMMGEKVAAGIILEEGASFDETSIRQEIGKTLARHKIPSYFILMDKFPVLPNGKTDKMGLKRQIEERVKNKK